MVALTGLLPGLSLSDAAVRPLRRHGVPHAVATFDVIVQFPWRSYRMMWLRRALPALVSIVMLAAPAFAQVAGHPVEVSGGAGLFKYDIRAHVKRGAAYLGTVGWRSQSWLTLEGTALLGPAKQDTFPGNDHNHAFFSADLRWNLRPAEDRVVPFVLTGVGYGSSHTSGHLPDRLD